MIGDNGYRNEGGGSSFSVKLVRILHLDPLLLFGILLLSITGMVVLYSAGDQSIALINKQTTRLVLAFVIMLALAHVPPSSLRFWSPWIYGVGIILLVLVLVAGDMGKGAQRWLDLGFIRFQPSEMMKLATPMMMAWFLSEKPLPPTLKTLLFAAVLILLPTFLIAKQPDLGTSLLIFAAGLFVVFLAGLSWSFMIAMGISGAALLPVLWHFMHDYQRNRVLTFLNPESDPLGTGYHIIQSKIAIGSGGIYGRGWLNGSQSHLDFLPEQSTDFIFAVFAEEFGLIGGILLLSLYAFIILRGLVIAANAQDTYARLLGGSLSMTFFVYLFVNVGMVSGILPVVGVPLPLISYGGTSMVTLMASFGMLMSINTHRKIWAR
ncbi:MAG: rod shape-determining protein RodA [Gammaproteobacteria bacterium]|nr:rod shape-determining protein RodA [Gammaproteobacteria bacterium]MCW8910681.1 rod shape-determining protein RodA [Gammaproteobacteria bacterium]MCW9006056.1 rod shape-determining protein RodA [Gammaproteobacteria bacterium]MCW9056278.1 rod shape-determining protein RodA [Gammaproteobacteria bacterium]